MRFGLTALTICCVAVGNAQTDVRTILQGQYDKVARLAIKKDTQNLARVMRKNATCSFEYLDKYRNSYDLRATVRMTDEQVSRVVKFVVNENKIVGMKTSGNTVVCTVKTRFDVVISPTEKTRVTGGSLSEDTWIKTIAGWKLRKSKILKETILKEGKPIKS